MYKVTIMPSGETLSVNENESLLTALKEGGHYIKSSCGGHASCTDCVVKILTGEDNVNPPEFDELQLIGNVFHITKERLSCQTKLTGDVTVDISNHDLKKDQAKTKAKTASFSKSKRNVKVRSKEQVEEIKKEREEKWAEKQEQGDTWHKHWEKDDSRGFKRMGGGKRPKEFRTDHIDHERDAKLKESALETRLARERYAKMTAEEDRKNKEEASKAAPAVETAASPEVNDVLGQEELAQPEKRRESNPERKSFRKKS